MAINIKARLFAEAVYLASSELSPDLTGESRIIQHRFERGVEGLEVVRIITDENGTEENSVPSMNGVKASMTLCRDQDCQGILRQVHSLRSKGSSVLA